MRIAFAGVLFCWAITVQAASTEKNYYSFPPGQASFAINPDNDIVLFRLAEDNKAILEKITDSGEPQDWSRHSVIRSMYTSGDLCNVSCNSKGENFIGWGYLFDDIFQTNIQHIGSSGTYNRPETFSGNNNQTYTPFNHCGLSAVSPLLQQENAYLAADTLNIKAGNCTHALEPAYDCLFITPVIKQTINGMIPPVVGIRGETLDIQEREAGTEQYDLCWSSPTLSSGYCVPLPEDFPPPYHQPIFAGHMKTDSTYSANAILMNSHKIIALALSGSPEVNDITLINQTSFEGVLSIPVHTVSINGLFTGAGNQQNVLSVFSMEASSQPKLHAFHVSLESNDFQQKTLSSFPDITLPTTLKPGILVQKHEDESGPANQIVLHFVTQEGASIFQIEDSGAPSYFGKIVLQNAPSEITSSLTHTTGHRIVTKLGNEQEQRLYELGILVNDRLQPSYRASLNTNEEIPGLEVHMDHLIRGQSPTRWTLVYYNENDDAISVLNDNQRTPTGCGIPVQSNEKVIGAYLNDAYVIETSNHELQDCIAQWLEKSQDETVSLHLMYYDQDRWQLAGRKFDIHAGGGWSTADYLWNPVNPDTILTGYSSTPLVDAATDTIGYRRLVLKSSQFDTYAVEKGGLSSAQIGVIAVTVPASIVELTTLGVIGLVYYRARSRNGYDALR